MKLKQPEDVAIHKITIEEADELKKKMKCIAKTQNINNDIHDNTTILDFFPLNKTKKKKARTTRSPKRTNRVAISFFPIEP